MEKTKLNELKEMSREERLAWFNEHKTEILDDELTGVNGGKIFGEYMGQENINPDSDVPYDGKWFSSPGYVCNNIVECEI